jgi:hypothetical protein
LNLGRGRDPGSRKKFIPDPWGKNALDTGSGSATLHLININRPVLAGNMSGRSLTVIDVLEPATWQKDRFLTATELFTGIGKLF